MDDTLLRLFRFGVSSHATIYIYALCLSRTLSGVDTSGGHLNAPLATLAGSGAAVEAFEGRSTVQGSSLSAVSAPDLDPDLSAVYSSLLNAAQSLLLERQRFARQFGLSGFDQFGGARQINEVLGYPSAFSLEDFRDRFENGGIARRIILMAPEAMGWAKISIVENRNLKKKTKLESEWQSLAKRLSVGNVFKRADIQAGIGEYSVIYIGVKEKIGSNATGAAEVLMQEMPRLNGADDIVFLRPLPQDQATITEFVGDSSDDRVDDPRYGLPKYYNIQLSRMHRHVTGTTSGALNSAQRKVHWSRIIHVTHEPLDNEIYTTPELQPIWHYLCDLDKLAGGGSEIFWKQALQKVLFDLDKDIGPDGSSIAGTVSGAPIDPKKLAAFQESKEKLKIELEEMANNLRQYVLSRGVTPKTIGAAAPDFANNVKTIIGLIAATKNKPQRKLMGSERGHLASTQDEKSDNDTIAARQDEFGSAVVRDFVDRLIKYNGLPAAKDEYNIEWPTEDEMDELNKARLVNLLTLANLNQFKADGTIIKTSDEIRDSVYGAEPLVMKDNTQLKPPANDPNVDPNADPASGITTNEQHKFSSTQLDFSEPLRSAVLSLGLSISDEDLATDGRETNPHVTVKYGIETDNATVVAALIKDFGSITLSLGESDVFESDEFDVVYLSVDSPDLVRLNSLISTTLKVTDTHDDYIPHVTLAYVESGKGINYKGLVLARDQSSVTISALVFSASDGITTEIPLI